MPHIQDINMIIIVSMLVEPEEQQRKDEELDFLIFNTFLMHQIVSFFITVCIESDEKPYMVVNRDRPWQLHIHSTTILCDNMRNPVPTSFSIWS